MLWLDHDWSISETQRVNIEVYTHLQSVLIAIYLLVRNVYEAHKIKLQIHVLVNVSRVGKCFEEQMHETRSNSSSKLFT